MAADQFVRPRVGRVVKRHRVAGDERDIAEASPQRLLRRAPARMLVTLGSEEPAEFARHSDEFLAGCP